MDSPALQSPPDQSALAGSAWRASTSRGKSIQFGVAGLLIFTTGVCILLAALRALGVEYWQLLIGFVFTVSFSLLIIVALEMHKHFTTRQLAERQTTDHGGPRNPYASPDEPAAPSRRHMLYEEEVDPTGINFLDPAGIEFVATNPATPVDDAVLDADLAETDQADVDQGSADPVETDLADSDTP